MSKNYSLNQQNNVFSAEYQVKKGETACAIARRNGLSLKTLQALNPTLDLNNIKAGQNINLKAAAKQQAAGSVFTSDAKKPIKEVKQASAAPLFASGTAKSSQPLTSFSKDVKPAAPVQKAKTTTNSNILTIEKYEQNMTPEAKLLTPFIKKKEGKAPGTYIAPDGKSTIGYGHLLINKPKFLTDIENKKLSPKEKNKLIKTALLKEENKTALKQALQKDLLDAIKTTGIKNVPSTVNKNLELTKEQIDLLLYADAKKAQDAMTKTFGKDVLSKRTTNQKLVALDLCFNIGRNLNNKAPEFVKQFKAGNMEKAQAELNLFKSNGKVLLGLIKRNYNRMLLLDDNKLSPLAQERLLAAYNKYLEDHAKKLAQNFSEAEKVLKKA